MSMKYEGFEDLKIIKNCEDYENAKPENDCKSFNFENENFLEHADDDVLYVDDSILIEEERSENHEGTQIKFSSAPKFDNKPPDCFTNTPIPLNEQMSLPIKNVDELSYYETFAISNELSSSGDLKIIPNVNAIDEIGSSSILVEELEDGKILIFITQQIFENGERQNLEILSLITKDLKLVHERQIKRKCSRTKSIEQLIHIIATDKGLILLKSRNDDEKVEHWRGSVDWTQQGDLLSRGANIILLRKMVLDKFIGCIQTYCCNIEGEFVLSQHVFHKPEQLLVFEKYERVQRVDQLLIFDGGKVHKIANFLSSATGRLLKQKYSFHKYQLHINPIAESKRMNKNISENWQEDLQLMSKYLEFKAKRKEELREKFESPCVKSALRDYIECLIKCKPKSVLDYTLEFIKKKEQSTTEDVRKSVERRLRQQS